VSGAQAAHVIAFARRHGNAWAIVIGTHLAAGLLDGDTPLVAPARWEDTAVELPKGRAEATLHDWLSDTGISDGNALALRDVLKAMPVAVLSTLARS
jgi:(1->4)-alpha-D-glucan 1-alpha-D-glucosylmutase